MDNRRFANNSKFHLYLKKRKQSNTTANNLDTKLDASTGRHSSLSATENKRSAFRTLVDVSTFTYAQETMEDEEAPSDDEDAEDKIKRLQEEINTHADILFENKVLHGRINPLEKNIDSLEQKNVNNAKKIKNQKVSIKYSIDVIHQYQDSERQLLQQIDLLKQKNDMNTKEIKKNEDQINHVLDILKIYQENERELLKVIIHYEAKHQQEKDENNLLKENYSKMINGNTKLNLEIKRKDKEVNQLADIVEKIKTDNVSLFKDKNSLTQKNYLLKQENASLKTKMAGLKHLFNQLDGGEPETISSDIAPTLNPATLQNPSKSNQNHQPMCTSALLPMQKGTMGHEIETKNSAWKNNTLPISSIFRPNRNNNKNTITKNITKPTIKGYPTPSE